MNAYDYHPNPDIDAGLRAEAIETEVLDLSLGYPARWWVCPECHATHRRGWFLGVGQHRCLRCGYVGDRGTMHTNDPRPAIEAERAAAQRFADAIEEVRTTEPLSKWLGRERTTE